KFIQKWARFGATLNQVPASVFIAGRDAFEPVLQRPRLRQADTDTAGGCAVSGGGRSCAGRANENVV
ncbi:TPA: hypothetical protein ACKMVS_001932, partial [Neisseria gonorrhoeae]